MEETITKLIKFKYLGVWIDKKLSFKHQIENLKNQSSQKTISHNENMRSKKQLKSAKRTIRVGANDRVDANDRLGANDTEPFREQCLAPYKL